MSDKYVRHLTPEQMQRLLDVVQNDDSRRRDPKWYRDGQWNKKALAMLERIWKDPSRSPGTFGLFEETAPWPFTQTSIKRYNSTDAYTDLELLDGSGFYQKRTRNRTAALWLVERIGQDEALRRRLVRCSYEVCQRFTLRKKAPTPSTSSYCSDTNQRLCRGRARDEHRRPPTTDRERKPLGWPDKYIGDT